ncbi:MAG: methyltransferase [Alphaproteobacteria bacterium]|nr:methyltransferase [Alphaproteobacteria bacterium]
MDDADLELLFADPLPAGRVLFMNAAPHAGLAAAKDRVTCVQGWKPVADALARAGCALAAAEGIYATSLVRLGRNRDVNRAMLARALDVLGPKGTLRVAGPNALGAASYEKDLKKLGLEGRSRSKGKARLFVAARGKADPAAWRGLDAPRELGSTGFVTAPGVFAWDRIDAGSQLLAGHIPADLSGVVADLGAGWGYLADAVLARAPAVERLDAFEADAAAIACLARNLAPYGARARALWHDVATGIGRESYDSAVVNPPFHDPRGENRALGLRFVAVAADGLKPGGRLWLVANRHLAYETALSEKFGEVRRLAEDAAFKVYFARK